jgi:hypothetical protein
VADASAIGTTTATLNGSVTPSGLTTNYHFDYGTTTGYGLSTLIGGAGAGTTAQAVASSVANLAPNTLYHYRLVASNPAGNGMSADRTFKTTSGGSSATDHRKPKATVSVNKRQRIRAITVIVSSDEAGSVLGTATASSTSLRPRASKVVTLGRRTARLSKPTRVHLKIKLSKSATRRLKHARKHSIKVTVRITVTDKAGNATALRRTITITH